MKPVTFEGANSVLKAPKGMDNCIDLPFCRHDYEGLVVATSCWELEDAEIITLLESKRIMIQVTGNTFPPMRLIVVEKGLT